MPPNRTRHYKLSGAGVQKRVSPSATRAVDNQPKRFNNSTRNDTNRVHLLMSQIEIIDQHSTIWGSCVASGEGLPPDTLAEILKDCRHRARFSSADGRLEAGRIPVESAKALAKVLAPHGGQITGWIAVNPHFLEPSLEAMELGVRQLGMRAIGEMIQYMEDWITDEYSVLPIVLLAGDLDVPINFHVGAADHVEGFVHLAESYPRTRFVMAHFGGRAWRFAWRIVKQAKLANLYAEVTGSPSPALAAQRIAAAIDAAGIERIVFGSDFCLQPGSRYTAGNALLDSLEYMKLKDKDIERICSLNAREMMRLDA